MLFETFVLFFIGLLNPLDLPHHLRVDDESEFREGIVMNKPVKQGSGSFVYIGLQKVSLQEQLNMILKIICAVIGDAPNILYLVHSATLQNIWLGQILNYLVI